MKRLIALLLTLMIAFSLTVTASATFEPESSLTRLFGTNDPITQEQLDLIFRRYTDALVTQDIPDYEGNSRHATRAQVAYALMSIDRAQKSAANDSVLNLTINGTALTATLADNSSAQALRELLADGPVTIDMKDYGNMEKVGPLGTILPTNNEQINTQAGDIILYQGNQITIYYDTNSWDLTRLGKVSLISCAASL